MNGEFSMKKAVILTYHLVNNSYSCLFYLKQAIESQCNVNIWGLTKKENMNDTFKKEYHSFLDLPYGKIPKVRALIAKLHAFIIGMKNDIVIINDFEFYIEAFLLKKLFPSKKIVFYCTEIPDENTRCPQYIIKFYQKHINFPDVIIDCLENRAQYRKNEYGLRSDYYIINNTIPQRMVDKTIDKKYDASRYLDFENSNPIVIYTGGCNVSRGIRGVIEAIPFFSERLNFVFFCHGEEKDINALKEKCTNYSNCRIYAGVDRTTLLNVMQYCDIGIQYYDPNVSMNTKLAAPSKFFEYLSLGLSVLSTDNEGINKMIEKDGLGVCIKNKQTAMDGLQHILDNNLLDKERIKREFYLKYCYEVDSKMTIDKLIDLIKSDEE